MTATQILERLKQLAPSVAFEVTREIDENEEEHGWNGSGPDPRDEGFEPHNVDVSATAVIEGAAISAYAYLGSCYYKNDEPIGDVHGYLPQLLGDAAKDLCEKVGVSDVGMAVHRQLCDVREFLNTESRTRYDAQRAEIETERKKAERKKAKGAKK